MKVYASSLIGNLENFTSRGLQTLIIRYWKLGVVYTVIHTGVEYCLFAIGPFQSLQSDKHGSTLFLFLSTMGQGGLIVYYMDAPTNLKHKPLVSIDDYDSNDGIYASNTDAMALSIGYAQYSNDKDTLTGKVWRRGHDKWSRMSEELPIHRIFDLTILFLSVLTKEDKIRCDLGKYKVHDDGEQVIRNLSSRGKLSEVLNDRIDMLKELIEKF